MKVGGNESATKFFQSHGGSAALASKDPKTKYTSAAAVKYKEELGRRVEADAKRFPNEVTLEDVLGAEGESGSGGNTPAGEPKDDFFSSWDKPAVKRGSNPPSRTGTPANAGGPARTGSPFLNANNGNANAARPKSPLNPVGDATTATAPKTISSSAIRKTALTSKPKANILGAKKTKLGAKKVDASVLDFDEAEKKAQEEAERKARLGYDPDEVTDVNATESEASIVAKQPASTATIHSPTPVSPPRGGAGKATEDVTVGVRRLGFGQVGGGGGAAPAPKKAAMGFGSTSKPAVGMCFPSPSSLYIETKADANSDDYDRRQRTLRPREIRRAERNLIRRILRPQRFRLQLEE